MEHSIDDHWSEALKCEKLKDNLLGKPTEFPWNVYTERAKSFIFIYEKYILY